MTSAVAAFTLHTRYSLLTTFIAFYQLPEISFRFGDVLIFALLVARLNNVQNSLDCTTASSVLANFELTSQSVKEFGAHNRIIRGSRLHRVVISQRRRVA